MWLSKCAPWAVDQERLQVLPTMVEVELSPLTGIAKVRNPLVSTVGLPGSGTRDGWRATNGIEAIPCEFVYLVAGSRLFFGDAWVHRLWENRNPLPRLCGGDRSLPVE